MNKFNILTAKTKVEGERIAGVVYVKTCEIKVSKNGKKYAQGMCVDKEETIPYKVWSDALDTFTTTYANSPIMYIEGKINVYNDTVSLIFETTISNSEYSNDDFIIGYDVQETKQAFYEVLNKLLTPAKLEIFNTVIKDKEERFFLEYAGKIMHDACPTGVARHTLKMLKIWEVLIENDPRLKEYQELITLGIAFHDLGKIKEMYDGCYQPNSFVTHRVFGAEFLYEYKNVIILNSSEDFFYHLLAVMHQHHGDYDEPTKTVPAEIVHLIDMLESQTTGMLDSIAADNLNIEVSGDKSIAFPKKLTIFNNK